MKKYICSKVFSVTFLIIAKIKYDGDTKYNMLSQEKKQQMKLSIYCNYDIKHYMKRVVKNSKMITALEWWIQNFFPIV